jgi:segregation and condensation protein A
VEEQNQSKQSLKLKLGSFEGPLDLLLHLINKLEIDIYDIPIAKITDQYMDYLRQMQEIQIDVAADYFVMAATLMRIKSEMLVPRNENQAEMEDFQEEEDPRQPLIELIIEYKQIKEVVPKFENRIEDRANYFGKDPTDISKYRETIELQEQGLNAEDLSNIFMDVLRRYDLESPQPKTIETDEVTVVERMDEIKNRITNSHRKKINFTQLIKNPTRQEIVVTFLALLELIKDNSVRVKQENLQSDISISFIEGSNFVKEEEQG